MGFYRFTFHLHPLPVLIGIIGCVILLENDTKGKMGFVEVQGTGEHGSYSRDELNRLLDLAEKGPCVIVGRCADYVLRENPDAVSVFVKADMPSKIARAVKYYGVEEDKAEERIRKADKQRASYYNYYATATWGDVDNYDLVVDTGVLGVEGAVELIAKFLELREAAK